MEHHTASTSPGPFSGENWFDPLEDAIRFRVRAFIEALVAEEAQAALGGRARYQRSGAPKYRNGHRHRQLVGTFGALTVSLPRVRLPGQMAAPLPGRGGQPGRGGGAAVHLRALSPTAMEVIADHQRHRTPARGVQAPGEDSMRTTQRGNGGHAVLGLDGLGADHHAPRRWLANTRPGAGQAAD